jgi:ABC-type nitrate/sulfonate/bicarbonate transport system substrate-binding protein
MRRLLAVAFVLVCACVALPDGTRAEVSRLTVIVFPGVQNLPMFAAQAKGFYASRSLDVDIRFTPDSAELRNGVAEGRYQIAHSAVDNAFALKDDANVDIAVVGGGDNSFNHLIVQPEITSLADIRGRTVGVDAVNTAYAFQLYEILRQSGIDKGDYAVRALGGTRIRLDSMTKDKAIAAAVMNPPFSIQGLRAGLKDFGGVATALGAYQGTAVFILRPWGTANADTLIKYLEAYIEGLRWAFDSKNKPDAVALLARRLNIPEDVAALSYDSTRDDFDRDGAISMDGVKNVLKLRAEFAGGKPAAPETYLDLSYYRRAAAGL